MLETYWWIDAFHEGNVRSGMEMRNVQLDIKQR